MASAIKTLYISNNELTLDKKFTYLASDVVSGSTSLRVQSITGATTNQIVLVGEVGREQSEIIFTDPSTSPASSLIFLKNGLTFAHPQDTKIHFLDWDSIELSNAVTALGVKTTLTISGGTGGTIAIQTDQEQTIYNDNQYTSGFYFTRFYNSTNARYSDYSDPVPYAGYADNTVWAIKHRALESVNEEISDLITHSFLNDALFEARREYHNAPGKRPFRQRFGYDLGNVSVGAYRIAPPADLESPSTAENVFGLRVGTEANIDYHTKPEHDQKYRSIPHTTLKYDYAVANADIGLTNPRDFTVSGTLNIEGDSIEYSARNVSTGTLTVSTAGTNAHSAGVDVWQNVSLGLPTNYTIFVNGDGSSYIYFSQPFSTSYIDQNIYCDYYRTVKVVDSDADEIDEPRSVQDGYVHWLAWKIKKKKDPSLKATNDDDYLLWQKTKIESLTTERSGQEIRFIPDTSHLDEY